MSHLTPRSYERLLDGSLPAGEAQDLARHLEAPCAVCEAFLAERTAADALDGRVDAALAAVAGGGVRGNDLEFARIERRVRAGASPARRRGGLAPALAAAAVLVVGLSGLLVLPGPPDRGGWDGVKGGAARPAPVRLRYAVVTPTPGAPPGIAGGVSGQAVPRGASLQFEIEAGRPAQVALVRVPARGAPELVWSERVASGVTAVTLEGRPAAYPLAELEGAQRFVLVASEERLAPEQLARAAALLPPPARAARDLPALDGLGIDAVDVEVR